MKKVILKVILAVCVLSIATFATLLVRELYIDGQSRSFYSDLTAGIETNPRQPGQTGTGGAQSGQAGEGAGGADGSGAEAWVPYVDFEELNSIFPGIVGWIKLEGTQIDYPVMQYRDNDFFLKHLPDGRPHRSGSIFLDYRNESDFSDKSTLIYGHETRAQDMFGVLKNYRNQEFFEANPVIHLYTPEKDYAIILFAGHVAHSVRDHPPLQLETDEDFLEYIDHIKSISVFKSDVQVTAEDRIVSLVTCTYDFNDARLIIVGIKKEA